MTKQEIEAEVERRFDEDANNKVYPVYWCEFIQEHYEELMKEELSKYHTNLEKVLSDLYPRLSINPPLLNKEGKKWDDDDLAAAADLLYEGYIVEHEPGEREYYKMCLRDQVESNNKGE